MPPPVASDGLAEEAASEEAAKEDEQKEPEERTRSRNRNATLSNMQAVLDDSEEEEEEVEQSHHKDAVDMVEEAIAVGEDVALSQMPKWKRIAQAFDDAYNLIDAISTPHGDDQESCDNQAILVHDLAVDANKSLVRCQTKALFSQCQMVSQEAFPLVIKKWGMRAQRANEQGQEQLGQLLKRILKYSVRKGRKKCKYFRLGKLCTYSATATKQSMEKLCLKLNVANKSTHKLLAKQRRGMKQYEMKAAGKVLKRERVVFSPLISTPLEELVNQQLLYAYDAEDVVL